MFLQYFVVGHLVRDAGHLPRRRRCKFTGAQHRRWPTAPPRSAAMIAPFFVGMIADRFFATEQHAGVLHLVGGGLLYFASTATAFATFYPAAAAVLPVLHADAGADQLAFVPPHERPRHGSFPAIRVLGTIGWIVAGLVDRRAAGSKPNAVPMRIAAGRVRSLLACYCLTLPHTPPPNAGQRQRLRDMLGLDALSADEANGRSPSSSSARS